MKVIEIAFTGYPVTDLKRARQFYEGVLGLKEARAFGDAKTAWVEYDLGPGTLAISNMAPEWKPSPGGGAVALEVDDFGAALERLKAAQVPIVNGPEETPVCHMVVVSDPDGNSIVIHRRKA
jgi:catechol 2,3-dioxygenase-like lactoylglutathione lyase family enzyme